MRLGVFTSLGVIVAAGCAVVPASRVTPAPAGAERVVYLVSHGWHVGIAVPGAHVSPAVWPESAELGEARYVEVGWGDADFYPASPGTTGLALRAAFRSHGSVLHVVAIDAPLADFFSESEIIAIAVSVGGFEGLTRFIHAHYARDAGGRPIVVGPGSYGRSRFYRAVGRYRLLDNSNHWTAKALRAAGCPIEPAAMATAGSVLRWAHDEGERCARPPAGIMPGR
jgi:uncharacterized protein (TIGR02117 family)